MDWDKLRIFHAVAEAGSLTHAGVTLDLSQPAVSRQIAALETELGARLFTRHARGLVLTEQGELLYKTAQEVMAKLAIAEAAIQDSREKPRGDLRVTATLGVGTYWLMPRLPEFLQAYPDIAMQLLLVDEELDLSRREADVALRMRKPVQTDLVQRKLFTVRYGVFASTGYLAARGVPQTLADLDGHAVLTYGGQAPSELEDVNWLVRAGRDEDAPRRPYLTVNTLSGLVLAAEQGLGLAMLPLYAAEQAKGLRRLLPEAATPVFDVHFVYAEPLKRLKRIVAFRDFVVRHAETWNF